MGQRQWILLRHGSAEAQSANGKDVDRELSAHGHEEAEAAAQWLQAQLKGRPLRVLSSAAARAAGTANIVAAAVGASVQFDARIYEATPGALMSMLNDADDDESTILLVGHNPGLEQTVALLGEGRTDEYRGLPTAAIAWFEVPAGLVEPGSARLTAFWSP